MTSSLIGFLPNFRILVPNQQLVKKTILPDAQGLLAAFVKGDRIILRPGAPGFAMTDVIWVILRPG